MKTRLISIVCVLALTLGSAVPGWAGPSSLEVMADVVVARPACLAVTIIGSAFFVISLPFTAPAGGVKETADILIVKPAQATFTRPVGDLDALRD